MKLPEGPYAVIGAGISGQSARNLLEAAGVESAQITLYDDVAGRGQYSDAAQMLAEFQPRTLVVSPGVPLATAWIREFEAGGGEVTSELELACRALKDERVVAVTGSVGKSTVVSLLGEGARSFCPDAFVGGNLGVPLASYAAQVLAGKRERTEWICLELSSFQLERARNLSCEVVAITSLLPNHLDRYSSLYDYYQAKWRLVETSRGAAWLNERGGETPNFAALKRDDRVQLVSAASSSLGGERLARLRLLGEHNRDNFALAWEVARSAGWPESCFDAMANFSGLPHRLQDAGAFNGVRFINDSKATTVESVLTALNAVAADVGTGQVWMLLGGRDKKLPWERLAPLKTRTNLRFAFFGECGPRVKEASTLEGTVYAKLDEALVSLKGQVVAGDVVLLSPGGSSLDEFKNFEERGDFFMKRVAELFG